jgi:hypothetical protein
MLVPQHIESPMGHPGYGHLHIASGHAGAALFGTLLAAGTAWNLCQGLRKGGDFGLYNWIFPPADRQHPWTYRAFAAGNALLFLAGLGLLASAFG